jgi:hypothetical protein
LPSDFVEMNYSWPANPARIVPASTDGSRTDGIESSGDRILEFRPQVCKLAARERALASLDEST